MKRNRRLTDLMKRIWRDECGAVHGGDYILMLTILCVGAVAGLATVRDAVVQNLGDSALALEFLDQSYSVTMTFGTLDGGTTEKKYGFVDTAPRVDPVFRPPHGIEICDPPILGESGI